MGGSDFTVWYFFIFWTLRAGPGLRQQSLKDIPQYDYEYIHPGLMQGFK